jgi:hypothetical protein
MAVRAGICSASKFIRSHEIRRRPARINVHCGPDEVAIDAALGSHPATVAVPFRAQGQRRSDLPGYFPSCVQWRVVAPRLGRKYRPGPPCCYRRGKCCLRSRPNLHLRSATARLPPSNRREADRGGCHRGECQSLCLHFILLFAPYGERDDKTTVPGTESCHSGKNR